MIATAGALVFALLVTLSSVAGAFECGTPGQLDALRGGGSDLDRARLTPKIAVHPPDHGTAPPPDRTLYGTPSTNHVETEHFSINWESPEVTDEIVEATAIAMETAWTSFVEEQGWPAPVSSDAHYLWVYLDTGLGSTTGYTTEFFNADYPDGLPLIYVNPANLPNFGWQFHHGLCAHEFMHAIQYAMRDYVYDSDNPDLENWYWEASATHGSELADPSLDGHQYTSAWYAEQPGERYDSYEGAHQYGMFVFNAWLDEARGPGAMQSTWELSIDRKGHSWRDILEESEGVAAEVLWGDFSDAYGNAQLAESHLYTTALNEGILQTGDGGTLDELGTAYWTVEGDVVVTPDSDGVILGGTVAPGEALRTGGSRVVSVTALADDTSYTLTVAEPSEEPGETDDTGEASSDTDRSGGDDAATEAAPSSPEKGGCSALGSLAGGGAWLGLCLVAARRRTGK